MVRFFCVIIAGVAIMTLTGCGKNSGAPETLQVHPAADSQPTPANRPAPVTVTPQYVAPVTAADASATLADLTQALRRYSMEQRKVPAALSELVSRGYLKALPAAPAGKKFAIDPKRVEVILAGQ